MEVCGDSQMGQANSYLYHDLYLPFQAVIHVVYIYVLSTYSGPMKIKTQFLP